MFLKSPFTYVTTLDTSLPVYEAMPRVQRALTYDKSIHTSEITGSDRELCFAVKYKAGELQNSFLPDVRVQFSNTQTGTQARIECRVILAIRIICICLMLSSVFSVLLLLLTFFLKRLDSILFALFPLVAIPFVYLWSRIGLRIGSDRVVTVIRRTLPA